LLLFLIEQPFREKRMGAAVVIAASLAAYLAAGIALALGAGWGTALLVLVVTGTGLTLLLGLAAARHPESGLGRAAGAAAVRERPARLSAARRIYPA
jgi:hypothetical protein